MLPFCCMLRDFAVALGFSLFFNGGFPAFLLVILVLVLVSDWWATVVVLVMVPFDLTVAAATPDPSRCVSCVIICQKWC